MVKYYLDESGNSGDVLSLKNGLGFAGQPFFTLAAVGLREVDSIESIINALKAKYKVQAAELKSTKIYKDKPGFILDLVKELVKAGVPFFVEAVDKRYYVSTAIVNHQVLPPYFTGDESNAEMQKMRNFISDHMAREMPDQYFNDFFMSCRSPTEESVLRSMGTIKSFYVGEDCFGEYKQFAEHMDSSVEDYHDLKKQLGDKAIKMFVPIPDKNKRGEDVYLLPHVSSLTNILARVNVAHDRDLSGVIFVHDKQDHFDGALNDIKELMLNFSAPANSPPTPNSDFSFVDGVELEFADSLKSIGVQVADVLAGFTSRYFAEFFRQDGEVDDIYHEIYKELMGGFDKKTSVGVNLVIPATMQCEFEAFHQTGIRKHPSPEQVIERIALNFSGI
ncbi:DUF3800 domain-containing protein [Pseudomonas sp. B33.4]|uniref:DUF3800 domain-containing protein n=1 Tax=Pseudomonas sp. B33.4 TaxID=3104265 RepID=UPI002ADED2E0|nr:DUF3800 domain-containing protein [Pseudomonas sp. B33.4]